MHFLIFIPGASGAGTQQLVDRGLPESFCAGATFIPWSEPSFDAGSGSVVIWDAENAPRNPSEWSQLDWIAAKPNGKLEAGRFWIGFDPTDLPTPEECKLAKLYPGHFVTFCDGREWLIPAYTRLDYGYVMGDDGEVERLPKEQWQEHCRRSKEITDNLFLALGIHDIVDENLTDENIERRNRVQELDVRHGCSYVANALGINYRLDVELALTFGMLDDRSMQQAIEAAIDLPEILVVREQKKSSDTVIIPVI